VSGLETAGFEARIGKQKIQIASMTPAPANRRAVLLLDVSGSMAGDRVHEKWPTAIAIANQVLSNAPASLSLGMIAFSDKLLNGLMLDRAHETRSQAGCKSTQA
jgi:uncharacterized protein with von Willebrand factor type A (vWA) domain